ncbi:pseudouridine synthase 10 isoform X1 [Brevipalpus obovatus]|uniref:pseudouridine synthase 10 isoform X1 n=1 Tax=Brevipalpus obovatus TaxID=246614 RepID=UPI003D9F468C
MKLLLKSTLSSHDEIVYIVGRYNKYSRNVCQTPWIIDGEKRMETSVQEIIIEKIGEFIQYEKYKFSSSGREDVDVRMLGRGRPFVIELTKPKCSTDINDEICALIEDSLNTNCKDVQVRDLQLGEKNEVKEMMKLGEAEKTKDYRALCCIDRDFTDEDLSKLNRIHDFIISQKTPIRVLHRRSLATRSRTIHKISGTRNDSNARLFTIDLTTEAGTYIKEFVHGDFGRTAPSLADILENCRTDIIKLDVQNISMDWPPTKNRTQVNIDRNEPT